MRSPQEGGGRKAKEEACLLSLLTSFVFVRLRSSSFVFVRLRSSSFVFVRPSCLVLLGSYRLASPSRHAVSYGRLVIRLLFRLRSRGVSFIFSSFRLVLGVSCSLVVICLWSCSLVPPDRGGYLLRWCLAVLFLVPVSRSHHCVSCSLLPPAIAFVLLTTFASPRPPAFASFPRSTPPCVSHRRSPNCPI